MKSGSLNFLESSGHVEPVIRTDFYHLQLFEDFSILFFTFEVLNPSNNCVSALIEGAIRAIISYSRFYKR